MSIICKLFGLNGSEAGFGALYRESSTKIKSFLKSCNPASTFRPKLQQSLHSGKLVLFLRFFASKLFLKKRPL